MKLKPAGMIMTRFTQGHNNERKREVSLNTVFYSLVAASSKEQLLVSSNTESKRPSFQIAVE